MCVCACAVHACTRVCVFVYVGARGTMEGGRVLQGNTSDGLRLCTENWSEITFRPFRAASDRIPFGGEVAGVTFPRSSSIASKCKNFFLLMRGFKIWSFSFGGKGLRERKGVQTKGRHKPVVLERCLSGTATC